MTACLFVAANVTFMTIYIPQNRKSLTLIIKRRVVYQMKKIILFPGQISNNFFENEIEYIKKEFEIVAIFSYNQNKEKVFKTLKDHGIDVKRCFIIKKYNWNIFRILKWVCNSKEVKNEIRNQCIHKSNGIKRFLYVLLYGMYALSVEKAVKRLNLSDEELYLYSFWMSRGAYAMLYIKQRNNWTRAHTVTRAHGYDLYLERNSMKYLPFRNLMNAQIEKICFISKEGKRYFENLYPKRNNKQVCYLGVSNPFDLSKKIIKKQEICIGSCSSVIAVKRIDYIIDCLAKMDGAVIHWFHIGDGNLMDSIRALAEEKLSHTTISYEFMGQIDNKKIFETYLKKDIDFFINLSDSEGIPVSIMEAMALGVPTIARNVGGIKEIVNSNTGLLLDEKWNEMNWNIIQQFILQRNNDWDRYSQYHAASKQMWLEHYNADRNYEYFFHNL